MAPVRFIRMLGVAVCVLALSSSARPASGAQTLVGEGESWPGPMIQKLLIDGVSSIAPYEPDYTDVGEANAREDLVSGAVDYAVLQGALTDSEKQTAAAAGRTFGYVPVAAGAVAVVVALDVDEQHGGGRVEHLSLKIPTLAKLYTHQIVQWNDQEILDQNPAESARINFLKVLQVIAVSRKDSSLSTGALISMFLADPQAKQIWNAYATSQDAPTDTPLDAWPNDPHSSSKQIISGSKGVIDTMLNLDPVTGEPIQAAASHHIGYVAPSWALKFHAPIATLTSNDGATKVDPTAESVGKALAAGTVDPATNMVKLRYGISSDGAYPAPLVSYLAVPLTGARDQAVAGALAGLVRFALGDAGRKSVSDAGYVPVSGDLRAAGLRVADAVAAAPTTAVTAPGATTPRVLAGRTGRAGSTLADTGRGPAWPVVFAGATLLLAAEMVRRRALRRPS